MIPQISKHTWAVVFLVSVAAALVVKAESTTRLGADDAELRRAVTSSIRVRDEQHTAERRLREGTMITDELGHFVEDGDGAKFVTKKGIQFGGLQNLNLERVVRLLKGADEPENIWWSVSGTVTEFDGRNYLLISRAVYKSASTPAAPIKISP